MKGLDVIADLVIKKTRPEIGTSLHRPVPGTSESVDVDEGEWHILEGIGVCGQIATDSSQLLLRPLSAKTLQVNHSCLLVMR
jgi:hypothetical protein